MPARMKAMCDIPMLYVDDIRIRGSKQGATNFKSMPKGSVSHAFANASLREPSFCKREPTWHYSFDLTRIIII